MEGAVMTLGGLSVYSTNIRLIITARFFSDFGAFLNMVALSTYVYMLSQSVLQVSLFLACRVTGGVLASLVGVPFFRRFRGRFSLLAFDILRASLLSLLLILPPGLQLYVLPAIALGIGLGNSMFAIGLNSQLPWWVEESRRISTNAWLTSLSAMGAVAGSLVAGILLASIGYEAVFLLNIVVCLLAGLCVLPLRFLITPTPSPAQSQRQEWRHLRSGLRSAPILGGMLLVTIADTLGSAAHNVGFPILSELITPASAGKTMGLLLAVWAAGKFTGARVADGLLRRGAVLRLERLFLVGVALMSLGFIGTFQQGAIPWALAFVAVAGIGDGISDVSLISRIQSEPEQLRLPVFSLMTLLQQTGFGIGMLIVAPFYVWFSPAVVIVIFHGLPLLTLVGVAFLNHRATRA
ncbi:MFS transporter [Pseudomonas sp. zfem002]|uniref:MFS transporter n=1 Tax=Pseudomonas sp. zfem002 TaxID=3078197 RepID=UPI002929FCFB|nr:MFS transporter [Pseudomonas sp. zfem002]MDU9392081.1 MFS transporter [Pseudomonas sp. zfem002]